MLSPGTHVPLQQGAVGIDGGVGRGSPRGPTQDSVQQDEFLLPRLTAPWPSIRSSLPCSKKLLLPVLSLADRSHPDEGWGGERILWHTPIMLPLHLYDRAY